MPTAATPRRSSCRAACVGVSRWRARWSIAPTVLFLDEPTVGIDPALRVQFWGFFRELSAAGTTLLVASHVMDEAERCDELLLILRGRLLARAAPRRSGNERARLISRARSSGSGPPRNPS